GAGTVGGGGLPALLRGPVAVERPPAPGAARGVTAGGRPGGGGGHHARADLPQPARLPRHGAAARFRGPPLRPLEVVVRRRGRAGWAVGLRARPWRWGRAPRGARWAVPPCGGCSTWWSGW